MKNKMQRDSRYTCWKKTGEITDMYVRAKKEKQERKQINSKRERQELYMLGGAIYMRKCKEELEQSGIDVRGLAVQ